MSELAAAKQRIEELERRLAAAETELYGRAETRYSTDARLNRLLGDPVVLATFPHLILVLSRELRILYVNRAEPGLNPADFIGVDCLAAMHPEDRERYRAVCEEA
ncbi:MAG TPA: PAS domain-containing protein, partial [Polyangiaceae bacterium]|nr:PAS domain-containing protein [Polyangiaceae bacterium]